MAGCRSPCSPPSSSKARPSQPASPKPSAGVTSKLRVMAAAVTTIRLARPADAPALAAMSRDTIESGLPWRYRDPEMLRFMRSPRYNVIVAESMDPTGGGFIAGFAVMGYGDIEAYLALLAVDAAQRGRGTGARLLDWLLKTADVAG